jgi:protein-tyrosine kinase
MSRIDEALRRAAIAGQAGGGVQDTVQLEPPATAIDPAIFNRYAEESQAAAPAEIAQPSREPSTVPPSESSAITIPPALLDRLVISPKVSPVTIEQYRRLAAQLHDLQVQHGLKCLMVTSAAPQEGKTLTVANLALTLSESYHQRVLVIDMDLRRPSIHDVFAIPNKAGLSDVVAGRKTTVPLVEISSCLTILTAGRHLDKPLAMLTSDRLRSVIADLSPRFEWILLDTPPIGILPDAQLVGRLSEAALFVIAAGVTPYAQVQRAISELGADRIVGTVLNRVESRMLTNHSYGGYYYAADTAGSR